MSPLTAQMLVFVMVDPARTAKSAAEPSAVGVWASTGGPTVMAASSTVRARATQRGIRCVPGHACRGCPRVPRARWLTGHHRRARVPCASDARTACGRGPIPGGGLGMRGPGPALGHCAARACPESSRRAIARAATRRPLGRRSRGPCSPRSRDVGWYPPPRAIAVSGAHAGVAQLAERQPSKLHVASSNLVSRSISPLPLIGSAGRGCSPGEQRHAALSVSRGHGISPAAARVPAPGVPGRTGR